MIFFLNHAATVDRHDLLSWPPSAFLAIYFPCCSGVVESSPLVIIRQMNMFVPLLIDLTRLLSSFAVVNHSLFVIFTAPSIPNILLINRIYVASSDLLRRPVH